MKFILFFIFSLTPLFSSHVLLFSGETVNCKILNQDGNGITVQDSTGIKQINKSDVLKVVYKDLSESELAEIRLEEERKKGISSKKKKSELIQENEIPEYIMFITKNEKCNFYNSKSEWFWLYGNFSISSDHAWKTLLPKDGRPVKVYHTSTWIDTVTTILLGTLFSVTKKTRMIEVCELEQKPKK